MGSHPRNQSWIIKILRVNLKHAGYQKKIPLISISSKALRDALFSVKNEEFEI